MSETCEPAAPRLPFGILAYGGSLLLYALDVHLLPRAIGGYGAIELEYRPLEQATRLAYLLMALLGWLQLRYFAGSGDNPQPHQPHPARGSRLLLAFGLVMVLLENNWDLTLRESLPGRLVFAVLLGAALLGLAGLSRPWGRLSPALFLLAGALLALGQVADTLHDRQADGVLGYALVRAFAGLPGVEEGSELLGAWVALHAAWRWHRRLPGTGRLWRLPHGARLVAGLAVFGVGNGFLAYKRHGPVGRFVSNEMAVLGFVMMVVGVLVVRRALRDPGFGAVVDSGPPSPGDSG